MADKVLCDKSDLVNIADAVRSKLGVTDTYYVSELSSAIQNIQTGGGGSAPSLQSKSVTYTSNGTNTITPDDGYDGMSSVDVTVDVSGSGGGVIQGLTLGSGYFNIHTDNVSFIGCDFMNITIQFIYGSTNISFTNCNFADSTIICEQSIRDAIENVSNNVDNVQFEIMT